MTLLVANHNVLCDAQGPKKVRVLKVHEVDVHHTKLVIGHLVVLTFRFFDIGKLPYSEAFGVE
jgi:hypothetical protein